VSLTGATERAFQRESFMKQSSINSSRCEASRSPSRSSVHWLWFAAARPAVYWSIDRETARHPNVSRNPDILRMSDSGRRFLQQRSEQS